MSGASSRRLRHAVIGAGAGVMKSHLPALMAKDVELVAVTDVNEERGRLRAAELGCAFYDDHRDMLAEKQPEVSVILAPQPFHARIAIDCLEAGSHVLVEKPMAVRLDEADAMIEAAEGADRLLAVNFQRRYLPELRAARRLLESGALGDVQRVNMTVYWPRPAAYYREAPWRAAPVVEGGGLLMNQASHSLDLLCYLFGMPVRVFAWTDTILHRIEVEDTVQAVFRWRDGAFGSFYTSTAGAGEEPNIAVSGTGGRMRILPGRIELDRFEMDFREYVATEPEPFGSPPGIEPVAVELETGPDAQLAVYRDLHDAIREGSRPLVDGFEGRRSLELASAMIYSGFVHQGVTLPLDRCKYESMLEELGEASSEGVL